jgi:hypothetical protein
MDDILVYASKHSLLSVVLLLLLRRLREISGSSLWSIDIILTRSWIVVDLSLLILEALSLVFLLLIPIE